MFVSAPSQECVDIIIVDDSVMEQEELFEVEIDSQQADSAVSIGSLNRTTVAITDNGKIYIVCVYHRLQILLARYVVYKIYFSILMLFPNLIIFLE